MENQFFQFSLDHALELVIAFGEDGKITYANETARQQLGYEEELCGCLVSDILPNSFQEANGGFETDCVFDSSEQQLMAYRKNHTCFPLKARMMRYDSLPAVYLCMAYDSTDLNFLEKKVNDAGQEAEAALKVKSEFIANVTHELRTPVNGILGNALELIEGETEESKLKNLRLIERGCKNMNALINSVLDFSKLEAGKFTLEARKFNFREMLDYVKGNHINKITEKGLDFFMTVSPEIPEYVIGDELRIVQILNNLLSNACKFTSVGKIALEVLKTSQIKSRVELFFLVIDTGIGIDKGEQDKLFKSFSQVDASISRKYGGTGLGLNISKQLVELMDGSIHVESEKGKGSIFSFHIWLEVPQEELQIQEDSVSTKIPDYQMPSLSDSNMNESVWQYGEPENLTELKKKMSKLILSVEMENWEKAEMFMNTVKQLTDGAPKEVKTAVLRLKMAVQKGDYTKTAAAFEELEKML